MICRNPGRSQRRQADAPAPRRSGTLRFVRRRRTDAIDRWRRRNERATSQAGRGALFILALLLAASGALRLGAGVGAALAKSPRPTETERAA